MTGPLDELARRYGVAAPEDEAGQKLTQVKASILAALGVDVRSEEAVAASLSRSQTLEPPQLRAPPGTRCHLPGWLETGRAWGISVQLYELRSERNWGIGDFADLGEICRIAAATGADFVGINPLHALFLSDPARCSPFSPSNRLFLNPLYIAVDEIPFHVAEFGEDDAARLLRAMDIVDYAGVAELKIAVLRRLFRIWQAGDNQSSRFSQAAFQDFRDRHDEPLRKHAVFEALSARMTTDGHASGWRDWPQEFQNAASPAVRDFAEAHQHDVLFHTWLQWIAHGQLIQVAHAARAVMRIGLYLDFAVGEAPDGSATWSHPELMVPGMSIGAPPDMFSANGQDWGLAPLSPLAMAGSEFAGFRRTNEALMRHAGALRIDHAMSLWQLFLVPDGGSPADGAYVRYPVEELVRILAEQSRQHRTIVIGEDLGHVPPGFRDVMTAAGILSYRIVIFEKQDGSFIDAASYPRIALACLSTHDMPTLAGWWRGDDIDLRVEHGLISPVDAEAQRIERRHDRAALIARLVAEGILDEAAAFEVGQHDRSTLPTLLAIAAHRFVASTRSMLACVRLADLTGERRQTNLPGTIDSYPNWRLKSSIALEDLPDTDLFKSITRAIAAERPRS